MNMKNRIIRNNNSYIDKTKKTSDGLASMLIL